MTTDSPLGRNAAYSDKYAPGLLCAVPRRDARDAIGIARQQPFTGVDVWNAWELTWLEPGGRPQVATAEIRVPADTPQLVESKSLKLYLNSFAMTEAQSLEHVASAVSRDLSDVAGGVVDVRLRYVGDSEWQRPARLPGTCIDTLDATCDAWETDPALLRADPGDTVREDLYSHLLRSLCPVTGQPDIGSVLFSYRGPKIDRRRLLRYIVSYRLHSDFHEACIERMFVDVLERCGASELTVCGFYQRRGGIDINPFRSNFEAAPRRLRLWRQ
jgi:7-cyano-7-deazaguanine reductase